MERINQPYVEHYLKSLIHEEDPEISQFRQICEASQIPIIHEEVGQLIKFLIRLTGASRILEIGTAVGFSSIFMSKIIHNPKGYITTIERNPKMVSQAIENFKSYTCPTPIEFLQGQAEDLIEQLDQAYDILFLDGAKSKYRLIYEKAGHLLRPGGLIIADNVLHKGMTATDDLVVRRQRTIVRNMREFLDYLSHDKQFETTILPMGDGVALTWKQG